MFVKNTPKRFIATTQNNLLKIWSRATETLSEIPQLQWKHSPYRSGQNRNTKVQLNLSYAGHVDVSIFHFRIQILGEISLFKT